MNRIVIEDWYLEKSFSPTKVWHRDGSGITGGDIWDYEDSQKSYRVIGTKEQIKEWSDSQDFILDEVYAYERITEDSWWNGICCSEIDNKLPTRKEYNEKHKKELEFYTKWYNENDKKVLVLRTN